MPLISFLMPAKNERCYITHAITSLVHQEWKNWELIVIDDHSEDDTLDIAQGWSGRDSRVHCFPNKGKGIIDGLNYGYSIAKGDFFKMIDADDILDLAYSQFVPYLLSQEASYHDAVLIDENQQEIGKLRNKNTFQTMDYTTAIRKIMISPPRWAWVFSRKVAMRIFPLPQSVSPPHEDVFIALSIKKNTPITYVPKPLYQYRQHRGQIYGGIFNFEQKVVIRRSKSMLSVIAALHESTIAENVDISSMLVPAKKSFEIMALEKAGWKTIIGASLSLKEKIKLAIVKKAPGLASRLSRIKSRLLIDIC